MNAFHIPGLGDFDADCGLVSLDMCSDGRFQTGRNGVVSISATGDRKVDFIAFADHTLAYVKSQLGYPAYYPLHPIEWEQSAPFTAVLMDLDGTSIHSEDFWVWIIQLTISTLLDNPSFELEDADLPYVAGHSVSEHLKYCLDKYCLQFTIEEARRVYFQHAHDEMEAIMQGSGRVDAFKPAPGLKQFLLLLKEAGIKIGLVTSGLYEKALPGIMSAFQTLGLDDPEAFYDTIITGGFPLRSGEAGTLGELSPKPHPWLYAEAMRIGLGVPFAQRHTVVGIDDSGAGVCAVRLAGLPTMGISGGNIIESGTKSLCHHYCESFAEMHELIRAS